MSKSGYIWKEPVPATTSPEIIHAFGDQPLLAEGLVRHGIQTVLHANAFLDPALYKTSPPSDLPTLDKAADRLEDAIRNGEKIGVWGDFDVDGQTATTILVDGFRNLGGIVEYHIPIRETESHGVNLETLPAFLKTGIKVLVTCDTGVTAHSAVDYAHQHSIETIITDHHTLPPELPDAFAVINPQRLLPSHPLRPLCGAGCAFKLIEELFARAGRAEEADQYLDLAALGTVADMALLTGDCRYLVQRGLAKLREATRPAIRTILELAEVKTPYLTEEHISFILAPRLNAIGRLADANLMVEFLTSKDPIFLKQTGNLLEALNGKRKLLCDQVFQGAQAQIGRDPVLLESPALVLNHSQWPAGVIGIVASRLAEIYHRPAILISTPPGQMGRASARSIEGINITSAIAENQRYLLGFGGHPMAAGFSIDPSQLPGFRRALSNTILSWTGGKIPEGSLTLDAYTDLANISIEQVQELERLAPFGPGNPSLILAVRNLTLLSTTTIGRTGEHLQLNIEDQKGIPRRVIWWQGAGRDLPDGLFDLACTARSTNFRGLPEVQIEWIDSRPAKNVLSPLATTPIDVMDYRGVDNAEEKLEELAREDELIIWREGGRKEPIPGYDRYHLVPARTLVVWNIPPGRQELKNTLLKVMPRRVVLFGIKVTSDEPGEFLLHLAGLIRFAIRKNAGKVQVSELAAVMGQREVTIQRGIDALAARGVIRVSKTLEQTLLVSEGGVLDPKERTNLDKEIRYLLQETAAFRDFYLRADPETLIGKVYQSDG